MISLAAVVLQVLCIVESILKHYLVTGILNTDIWYFKYFAVSIFVFSISTTSEWVFCPPLRTTHVVQGHMSIAFPRAYTCRILNLWAQHGQLLWRMEHRRMEMIYCRRFVWLQQRASETLMKEPTLIPVLLICMCHRALLPCSRTDYAFHLVCLSVCLFHACPYWTYWTYWTRVDKLFARQTKTVLDMPKGPDIKFA